ncbi:hypothetical protein FBU59_006248 [Linderina macrospora]|uniref:Uncharacterized protein n=1 Tax=Linderina macrospora TaxID=4868 RepID=A0ACC1J0D2_9FUNG|nr:hypothetical protein FBU59_006248 [Linderina macrospora]
MANSTNELLRAALNAGRTPSAQGRSSSKRSSARHTPKGSGRASRVMSRDGSDDEYDDTASFASDETWVIWEEEEEMEEKLEGEDVEQQQQVETVDNWEDIITAALDAMSEKRVR